jgi:phosphoglycerate dehydrogenase-like enzyme
MQQSLISFHLPDFCVERIQALLPDWQVFNSPDEAVLSETLGAATILVGWRRKAEALCLDQPSALRWIHLWGAGADGMPLAKIRQRGIILTNSSGVHAFPISETVLAMMLSFTRGLHHYLRHQLNQEWHHDLALPEIHGQTIGILGVGAIGREIARLARAFQMRVLGCRRSGEPLPEVDQMYHPASLPDMLPQCDFLVNTLPLTAETFHFIGRDQFQLMRPTAFYINIGRGATTDTAALIAALAENRLGGAGLDVFETEPLPPDNPLWKMANVLITPHNSGPTIYYDKRALAIFLDNLQDFLSGREPRLNRIDPELGY